MRKNIVSSLVVGAILCVGLPFGATARGAEKAATEDALIAVLKSEAAFKEKCDACRELAIVGTSKAVPALAALLPDEKLSHMARFALEPIADGAVDAALRAALSQTKGGTLAGVIGSIGVRRDPAAVAALGGLLGDADGVVAQAAARALGMYGTQATTELVAKALAKTAADNRAAFSEGVLRGAEALAREGKRNEAGAYYDQLRAMSGAPPQVSTAALRGSVLMRGDAGLPLLLEALRGKDMVLVRAAVRTAMELPDTKVTEAVAGELAALPARNQVLAIQALGIRGDKAALPALCALAKTGSRAARAAIVGALAQIGGAGALPALVALTGDEAQDVAASARTALAGMDGPEADAALGAMLGDKDPKVRAMAIELLGSRRSIGAIPALLKAAETGDEALRVPSIKAVGRMARAEDFPALVALLVKAPGAAERQALEEVLSQLCVRFSQLAPGEVTVRKALYGDLPNGTSADVTAKVAEIVKQGAIVIEASNTVFGDPANGISKKLSVEYTVGGRTRTETVAEGATLRLAGGTTPKALVDALRNAEAQASPEAKQALQRILGVTRGEAK